MVEVGEGNFRAAHRLHDRLFEGSADRHDFARRLHAGAELALCIEELIEGPLGELDDDVVDGGLEAGERLARDVVFDLVESVAEGDLGRHFGDGIARRLRSERRGTRHTGVDLDDGVFETVGMQRELAVAAAFDAELGDDLERGGTKHLIVFIGEGESGCDDDGIDRVHADGVEVFHRADGEHVPRAVAQHFELDLLPAADILFDEHLRDGREHEPVVGDEAELLLVVRDAAARAAQRERGTHDDGIAELFCDLNAFVDRIGDVGRNDGLMDLFHRLFEEFAILRPVDGIELGADELDAPFIQKARFCELAAHRKAGLAAEGGKEGVGALLDDDAL